MKFPINRRLPKAFTLIELLVVIAIIATLATIATPVTKTVLNKARKASAQNDCVQLQSAIRAFYNEYYRYPVSAQSEGPYKSDATLMDVLMNNETAEVENMNPRHITFYEPSKITNEDKSGGYHSGTGRLNDPWGQPYEAFMDADDDEKLSVPPMYGKRFGTSGRIKKPVMVHSGGPDRKMNESKDNVTSWD